VGTSNQYGLTSKHTYAPHSFFLSNILYATSVCYVGTTDNIPITFNSCSLKFPKYLLREGDQISGPYIRWCHYCYHLTSRCAHHFIITNCKNLKNIKLGWPQMAQSFSPICLYLRITELTVANEYLMWIICVNNQNFLESLSV
jgi:hypothetical protein